ncbi:MAG: shikimate kinase [Magnetococcales bacterium]|nr:shikimate kinase [Magnetococcales bacterium]
MNIALIGARGVGKSKVARQLSCLIKRPVLSTDLLICYEQGGRSIAEIIAAYRGNWAAFRDMEYEVVAKVSALDGLIIDCGGGVVVDVDAYGEEYFSQRKIDLLRRQGRVIWLRCDPALLAQRTANDPRRPALHSSLTAEQLIRQRAPLYEQAADQIIDTDGLTSRTIASQLQRSLNPFL